MKIKCLLGIHKYLIISGLNSGATINPLGGSIKEFTLPSFDIWYCHCCKKVKAKKTKPKIMEINSFEFRSKEEENLTGLTDINGKFICVGSIVTFKNKEYKVVYSAYGDGLSQDEGGGQAGYYLKDNSSWLMPLTRFMDLEVVTPAEDNNNEVA